MQRAIDLAQLGMGYVSPNPMVGAVIVYNNKIIGESYHQKCGEAHAEVNAINYVLNKYVDAEKILQQSTIYVSLEPCSHYGKTPPCVDLIIKYKLQHVVVGCTDLNPKVKGQGIKKLLNAGIKVTYGILEQECIRLNKRFFTSINKQRPYIILKWAQTADGFFAPHGNLQYWITSAASKTLVHKWRSQEDCVLVGKNTAKIDNPNLNVRLITGRNPKRAVIDRDLELPNHLLLFDNSEDTFVFNKLKTCIEYKTKFIAFEDFDYLLPQYILNQLYLNNVQSVIIEGGSKTLQTFIDANLWDEARVFTGKNYIFDGIKAPLFNGELLYTQNIVTDCLVLFINNTN